MFFAKMAGDIIRLHESWWEKRKCGEVKRRLECITKLSKTLKMTLISPAIDLLHIKLSLKTWLSHGLVPRKHVSEKNTTPGVFCLREHSVNLFVLSFAFRCIRDLQKRNILLFPNHSGIMRTPSLDEWSRDFKVILSVHEQCFLTTFLQRGERKKKPKTLCTVNILLITFCIHDSLSANAGPGPTRRCENTRCVFGLKISNKKVISCRLIPRTSVLVDRIFFLFFIFSFSWNRGAFIRLYFVLSERGVLSARWRKK